MTKSWKTSRRGLVGATRLTRPTSLFDLEVPGIKRNVVPDLAHCDVPLHRLGEAIGEFLGKTQFVLRRHGKAIDVMKIAKPLFDASKYPPF